ncbi:unnamed protein product [Orchesella dallaii]|uniref:Uncharacterized protein n=1 Tax=Orchesella dallaii TaxID=48710 RepID=A0ABP1RKF9_9HEXA
MSDAIETNCISQNANQFFQSTQYWVTETRDFNEKWSKLRDDVTEVKNWGEIEVAGRLRAASINPAMSRWTEHIGNVGTTYHNMKIKCIVFSDRVDDFKQVMANEKVMWSNNAQQWPFIATDPVKFIFQKWNERTKVLDEWRTTINGLVAEWDEEVKMEIQEGYRNCVFMVDSLL